MTFHAAVRDQVLAVLGKTSSIDPGPLNNALRLLAKWRSTLICKTLLGKQGVAVQSGPFQGMRFIERSAEGCHIAKLLGCYEQPLHQAMENAIVRNYASVLNIGCAEGYYAIGMALRMPSSRVYAYDQNPDAREKCQQLAIENGVSERLTVGGRFRVEDFASFAEHSTLVICDVEGAEIQLLDPASAPALRHMDLIVETHDCLTPGVTQQLYERFAATHEITVIKDHGQRSFADLPDWFHELAHLDQLLAVWEWRSGPTPWLVMRAKVRLPKPAPPAQIAPRQQTAAIYFAPDGYQTSTNKLMGRQVAGAGFLRAFAETETAPRVTGLLAKPAFADAFVEDLRRVGYQGEIRTLGIEQQQALIDPGVLYLPGPGLSDLAWQRLAAGQHAYSLCGVTHTTASHAAMESITQLIQAPLAEWDALICTSQAVLGTVQTLLEAQHDYFNWRFGAQTASLPQLPVIPLGVHCQDYLFSEPQRQHARTEIGAGEGDIVVIFVGRLSFHAKAHPQAMYLALEEVASRFPERTIHLVQCGWFANQAIEKAFREAAGLLNASVRHHFLDGRRADLLARTWAAADIYISLSDNIQETFGLSPLEAMAAGLPVVVSDWDGYRDTVRDGIDGFRIPTLIPSPSAGGDLAWRYDRGIDSYDMYCGHTAELIAVDVAATVDAIVQLIRNPALRKQMGEAGRQRVRALFDWTHVLQAYRALWFELAERRRLAKGKLPPRPGRPERMDPFTLFAGYPSGVLGDQAALFLVHGSLDEAIFCLEQRRQLGLNSFARHVYPEPHECRAVLEQLALRPGLSVQSLLAIFPPARREAIRRGLVWMIKMHVVKFPVVS